MEYGSIFGHGAYLGPDYTADYVPIFNATLWAAAGWLFFSKSWLPFHQHGFLEILGGTSAGRGLS
jgi:hypothetical protein